MTYYLISPKENERTLLRIDLNRIRERIAKCKVGIGEDRELFFKLLIRERNLIHKIKNISKKIKKENMKREEFRRKQRLWRLGILL